MNDIEHQQKMAKENTNELREILEFNQKEVNENVANCLGKIKSQETLKRLELEGIFS